MKHSESAINLKMSRDPCGVHFTKEIKKKKYSEQLEERGNLRSVLHFVNWCVSHSDGRYPTEAPEEEFTLKCHTKE